MSRLNISVVLHYSFSTDSAGNLSNFLFPKVLVWSFSVIHFQNYFSHQPLLHGISSRTKTGGLAEHDLWSLFPNVYFSTLPVLFETLHHNDKTVFYNSNRWRKKSQNTKNVSVFLTQILSNTFTFTLNLCFISFVLIEIFSCRIFLGTSLLPTWVQGDHNYGILSCRK